MKTKDGKELNVTALSWLDATTEIKKLHPELSDIMKQLDFSSKEFIFYKASYAFGNKILSDHDNFIPMKNGDCISVNDPQLPNDLRESLSFDNSRENPLGMILSKTSELYDHRNNEIYSRNLLFPGHIFGIPRALDSYNINRSSILNSNLNAGGRSIFMLNKISDKKCNKKVSQFLGINNPNTELLEDHWQTFVEIAKSSNSDWRCEILYFPRNFIKKLNLKEYASLSFHLHKIHSSYYDAWHGIGSLWRQQHDLMLKDKKINQYNPHIINIVKDLLMLGANSFIGYKPVTDNSQFPFELIKNIYKNEYGLTSPILMEAAKFNFRNPYSQPVYISFSYQKSICNNILLSGKKTNMDALREVTYVNNIVKSNILKLFNKNNNLFQLISMIKLSYYHNKISEVTEIMRSLEVLQDDDRFQCEEDDFPGNSSFFNGCIKISL